MAKRSKNKKSFSFGKLFEVQLLFKNLSFVIFVTLLGILYIANTHRAEKKVRKIQKLQGEIDKSKWQYWESMSNVMYEGIQSQTQNRVEDLGLKASEGSIRIIEKDTTIEDQL